MNRPLIKRPTIRDVASLANVGIMTVSRVMNDVPTVDPATRSRVQAAIQKIGYQQNEAARMLKGRPSMTIGLVVPDLSDAFFASCAHTAQQIARAHNYVTLIASSGRDIDLEAAEAELMVSRSIAGILISTSTMKKSSRLERLQNSGVVFVALARPLTGLTADTVLVENRKGAVEAVDHLVAHGHRRIVSVSHGHGAFTTSERMLGYCESMEARGYKPQVVDLDTLADKKAWFEKLMHSRKRPTAIFTLSHRASVSMFWLLSGAGVSIPDDMAIIGFDDFELAGLLSPPLTTVSQSPQELTREAMALLLSRLKTRADASVATKAQTVILPVRLTLRTSCGCPPA